MSNGSFNGLYTFEQVANIYNIDSSTIRKQVKASKFSKNEIKKFGKTWIITEQAMKSHFGSEVLEAYKKQLILNDARDLKMKKEKAKKEKEKIQSMDSNSEAFEDKFTWDEIKFDEKNIMKSFDLS